VHPAVSKKLPNLLIKKTSLYKGVFQKPEQMYMSSKRKKNKDCTNCENRTCLPNPNSQIGSKNHNC